MRARAEYFLLIVAAGLGVWRIAQMSPVPWGHYSVLLPLGLLALALINTGLRSKVLAWGIFTLALVIFMLAFGAVTVTYRISPQAALLEFLRALTFYAAIGAAALYQLRLHEKKEIEQFQKG